MAAQVDKATLTITGLTESEAARKLQEEGYNELPTSKRRGVAKILLCHLAPPDNEQLTKQAKQMAKEGLRVLGVARARYPGGELPDGSAIKLKSCLKKSAPS